LILYKAFKEVASDLRENESIWRDTFSPPGERERYEEDIKESDSGQTSLLDLLVALENMTEKNAPPPTHRISRPLLSLTECLVALDRLLPPDMRVSFSEALGENPDGARVVSFYIAVLELMKRGWLSAEQSYPLAEITMMRIEERWKVDA
ncbi:MAG: hypothetical protein GY852_00290, partial [bacterium]|nr:hypothetical protein [bacterium]